MKFKTNFSPVFFLLIALIFASCNSDELSKLPTVNDIDGNSYHYVTIGTQTWMIENLRTTRFRNGDTIHTTVPAKKDISTEATPIYQWPCDSDANKVTDYGRLYTWYAVSDTRNIAPEGWRVANDDDWTTLELYLENNGYNNSGTTDTAKVRSVKHDIAKAMCSKLTWKTDLQIGAVGNNLTKNNKSGFAAVGASHRLANGSFYPLGIFGYYWTTSDGDVAGSAWVRSFYFGKSNVDRKAISKNIGGYSVRCIKE